ncbi:hypothetical protein QZH41_015292, partial [Actinostola sp. cb2023]
MVVLWLSAAMHLIKANLGIGVLGLPFAVMNAGIVVGPLLILFTGIIIMHCMHLLVQSSHAFCDRWRLISTRGLSNYFYRSKYMSLGYAEVAEMAVGLYYPQKKSIGSLLVNIFLIFTQLGFCCIYLIFVAETLQQILTEQMYLDVKVWIAIILAPVILLSFIRTLKVMAVLSAIANVLYVSGIVCLLIYAGQTIQNPETFPKFVGFASIPLSFSSIVFAFEAIGVILPVENMMALPRVFRHVINGAMLVVLLVAVLLGTLGYLSCGQQCLGSFTLNLPNTVFGSTVKLMLATAIFFTYFIQFYVPMTIIIPPLKEKTPEKYHNLVDFGVRTLVVCCT